MATVRVGPVNEAVLNALRRSASARRLLQEFGDQIGADAAEMAPKRTGAGAASIRCDVVDQPDGAEAHISWDRDHFYMAFQELGTSQQSARPFLRPAAERRRRL